MSMKGTTKPRNMATAPPLFGSDINMASFAMDASPFTVAIKPPIGTLHFIMTAVTRKLEGAWFVDGLNGKPVTVQSVGGMLDDGVPYAGESSPRRGTAEVKFARRQLEATVVQWLELGFSELGSTTNQGLDDPVLGCLIKTYVGRNASSEAFKSYGSKSNVGGLGRFKKDLISRMHAQAENMLNTLAKLDEALPEGAPRFGAVFAYHSAVLNVSTHGLKKGKHFYPTSTLPSRRRQKFDKG
jgi:hypothetical protein